MKDGSVVNNPNMFSEEELRNQINKTHFDPIIKDLIM